MGEIIRAILESLALAYKLSLEQVTGVSKRTVEVIHIVGGGTQNKLLNQMTADATGLPVITGPIEATVLGNALVQLITLGEVANLTEARQLVAAMDDTERYEPDMRVSAEWQAAYERYKQLTEPQ